MRMLRYTSQHINVQLRLPSNKQYSGLPFDFLSLDPVDLGVEKFICEPDDSETLFRVLVEVVMEVRRYCVKAGAVIEVRLDYISSKLIII